MLLKASCSFKFDIYEPTPFLLMLRPQSNKKQVINSQKYITYPKVEISEFKDIYGNLYQKLIAPVGEFKIKTNSKVLIKKDSKKKIDKNFIKIEDLPHDVLVYLLPSRYCQSDCFNQMAVEITQNKDLGYDQVAAITNWIRDNITYESNNSDIQVSAIEVNIRKYGVCRDFAHLAIALCRSISIPARMAVGYLYELEPMDLHAWFEVYIGSNWYRFDATQKDEKLGYVSIAYGRDAADVAIYNQYGATLFPLSQKVKVKKIKN
jgi:transglutaminase-like putative cysteine protease